MINFFCIIEYITVHKSKVYLLVEIMEFASYHFHFNAYLGTTTYLVSDLKKLIDYYPLDSYKINNMFLIQLRNHIIKIKL